MRFPSKPPLSPKHTEERLKLAANGLQAFALTIFAAVLIAPILNHALTTPFWMRAVTIVLCGLAELGAFTALRYIPPTPSPKEPDRV